MSGRTHASVRTIPLAAVCVFLAAAGHPSAGAAEAVKWLLTEDGKPVFSIVTIGGAEPALLMQRAGDAIGQTVQRWAGVELPRVAVGEGADLPARSAIVLGTLDRLRRVAPEVETADPAVMGVAFMDEHAFAVVPIRFAGVPRLFVVARTASGVFNGATYVRDFLIDGPRCGLYLQAETVLRSPQMSGRAAYTLTIWGHEARYTAADWERIFDSFARDGFDRIYFWVSGHFPSRKYPQTYKCRDGEWDTTEDSRIGTVPDLRRIIRYAHAMGLKIYHGGALGGWCGTGMLTNNAPGTMKTGTGIAARSLCPSHPASRKALVESYKEIFDALPEADGVFIESADEWGECVCSECARPLDEFGSRQFGRAQLTLVQEIMREIWRDHPHARLCYTIGYAEHGKDPAYYEIVRQMSDPRIEWMEARDSWEFPGPRGTSLPASCFSRRVMRWRQYYGLPLADLVADADRAGRSGFYGLITAFEPGAGTGSYYTDIPYPTDILPYVLTGFVWREATWEPALNVDDMRKRVQRRFFGAEASRELAADLWMLRELIREQSGRKEMAPQVEQTLSQIELRIRQAAPNAGPKTAESLALMTRAIDDTRKHLHTPRR